MPSRLTLPSALRKIADNFDKEAYAKFRYDKEGDRWSKGIPSREAVWCAKSDLEPSWAVDEEWLGVRRDGSIVWAYASGCSCWDGSYEVKAVGKAKDLKTFKMNHDHLPKAWAEAIIEFAMTGELQALV